MGLILSEKYAWAPRGPSAAADVKKWQDFRMKLLSPSWTSGYGAEGVAPDQKSNEFDSS